MNLSSGARLDAYQATREATDPDFEWSPVEDVAVEWQGHIFRATGLRVGINWVGYVEDDHRMLIRTTSLEHEAATYIITATAAITLAAGLPLGSVKISRAGDLRLSIAVQLPKPHRCNRGCFDLEAYGVAVSTRHHHYLPDELRPPRRGYGWTAEQFAEASRAAFAPPPQPKACHCTHAPSAHRDRPGVGCTHRGCLCLDTPTLAAQENPCPARSAPASPPASQPDPPSPSSPATSSPTSPHRCGSSLSRWLGTMRAGSW